MGLKDILVGMTKELLTIPDKPAYIPPTAEAVRRGEYTVYKITAANYQEAARICDGYTVAGAVHKELHHVGRNKWEARIVCNDTELRR